MWIWLVLLYGVFKGLREICKKKALQISPTAEVLFVYSLISFLFLIPDVRNAMGLQMRYHIYIMIKSFVIFVAWICSFKAIKKLPLSLMGVLDLSRVLFSTTLGVLVLGEVMSTLHIIGLIFVCAGLLLLKWPVKAVTDGNDKRTVPGEEAKRNVPGVSVVYIIFAFISSLLNAVSGLMDKILMSDINSSQLQFWYMLYLVIFYLVYMLCSHNDINLKRAFSNIWIWILSILFVIADRALFIANADPASKVTIMTLIKQAGVIVTILAGRFIFKEKRTTHKLICAGVIIIGIVLGAIKN